MKENLNPEKENLIIQRLQQRRKELGLSYQELSERTGLSKSTLQRYETGDIMNIPLSKIDILAKALQISPKYIMGWQDNLNPLTISFSLTIKEKEIIKEYRSLNEEGKEKIIDYIDDLVTSGKYSALDYKEASSDEKNTIEIMPDDYAEFMKDRDAFIKKHALPYAAAGGDASNLDEAQEGFDNALKAKEEKENG